MNESLHAMRRPQLVQVDRVCDHKASAPSAGKPYLGLGFLKAAYVLCAGEPHLAELLLQRLLDLFAGPVLLWPLLAARPAGAADAAARLSADPPLARSAPVAGAAAAGQYLFAGCEPLLASRQRGLGQLSA